jgi:hypothetical protein
MKMEKLKALLSYVYRSYECCYATGLFSLTGAYFLRWYVLMEAASFFPFNSTFKHGI